MKKYMVKCWVMADSFSEAAEKLNNASKKIADDNVSLGSIISEED